MISESLPWKHPTHGSNQVTTPGPWWSRQTLSCERAPLPMTKQLKWRRNVMKFVRSHRADRSRFFDDPRESYWAQRSLMESIWSTKLIRRLIRQFVQLCLELPGSLRPARQNPYKKQKWIKTVCTRHKVKFGKNRMNHYFQLIERNNRVLKIVVFFISRGLLDAIND